MDKPFSYRILELQKMQIDSLLESLDQRYALMEEKGVDPKDGFVAAMAVSGADSAVRQYKMPSPKRMALQQYIEALDEPLAKKLTALMYLGRGDADTFADIYETVDGWSLQSCQHALADKGLCLHEYLFEGVAKLRQEGAEIDQM